MARTRDCRNLMLVVALAGAPTFAAAAEEPAPPIVESDTTVIGGTSFQDDPLARATELIRDERSAEAEKLLVLYLIERPDDSRAKQLLLSARIAELEGEIRKIIGEQAEIKEVLVGDPDYEAARARVEQAVRERLKTVEYFSAQSRYLEAITACNAILNDYPLNPAVLQAKMKILRVLQKKVADERTVIKRDKKEAHDEAINETIEHSIYPRERAKLARTVLIYDEDLARAEREELETKFNAKIDLTVDGEDVRKVVERLFAIAGINYMIMDNTIGSELVTIHMQQQSIHNALKALTKQVPIAFNYTGGMVYISKQPAATGEVMETEIIRLESGLTNIGKKPKPSNTQGLGTATNAGGGSGGGMNFPGSNIPVPQQPGGDPNAQGQEEDKTDLEKFIDEIPDLVVGWPVADAKIYLDLKSNSLYIRATPAAIAEVKRLLHALDYNTVQVLIETRFLEVSENAIRELGINWESGYNGRHVDVTGTNPTGPATINSNSAVTGESPANGLFGVVRGTNFGGMPDFNAQITALETRGQADTLAEPKILTLNNATGYISVTQEVAFISSYTTNQFQNNTVPGIGLNPPTSNYTTVAQPVPQKAEHGIELQIQPSVAAKSDTITLRLTPKVTELRRFFTYSYTYQPSPGSAPITLPAQIPEFDKRQLETIMHVKNGQTVALGGLTRERDQASESGLPFMSRVPLLGYLFGRKSKQHDRRNLIILVTAHLIDPTGATLGDEVRFLQDTTRVVLPEDVRAKLSQNDSDDKAAAQKAAAAANSNGRKTGNAPGKGK
jgi:MSHA biogenesis protein MshL